MTTMKVGDKVKLGMPQTWQGDELRGTVVSFDKHLGADLVKVAWEDGRVFEVWTSKVDVVENN